MATKLRKYINVIRIIKPPFQNTFHNKHLKSNQYIYIFFSKLGQSYLSNLPKFSWLVTADNRNNL